MKKINLSMLAIVCAAASLMAAPKAPVKKLKQATCTSCQKGQKCPKTTCYNPQACCQ